MRNKLSAQINFIINAFILTVVVATPLLFTPLFTEFYDSSKLLVIIAATVVLAFLWALDWTLSGRTRLTRSPFDLPLILLAIVIALSAAVSQTQYVSIFGNLPRVHGSAASYIAYIGLFFVIVSHIRSMAQVRNIILAMLTTGVMVAVISLLSYLGLYLPFPFAKFPAFNTTGSAFATNAYLLMLLPLLLFSALRTRKDENGFNMPAGTAIALATFFAAVIALTGSTASDNWTIILSPAYIGLVAVFGFVGLSAKGTVLKQRGVLLAIPAIVSIVLLVLSFMPWFSQANPLHARMQNYQAFQEAQLPFSTSWKVAIFSFGEKPFLGTGPATFGFNFTKYKPIEFNDSRFWNIRFDTAYNEFLQTLSTTGFLGIIALMFFAAVAISFSYRVVSEENNTLASGLATSVIIGIVLLAVHTTTLVSMVMLMISLALLIIVRRGENGVKEFTVGDTNAVSSNTISSNKVLAFLILAVITVLGLGTLYQAGNVAYADFYHRMALNTAATRGVDTYNNLLIARNINPNVDLYRTDLSQTAFALADLIVRSKGPTEASPAGSLTDEDKANVQQLLAQAIQETQVATVINPRNAANFEILAGIYRQISGVAENALEFALNAYGQAINLDPYNPVLHLNAGGIYYSIQNYDLAIRFFTNAVNLKPDYANAYYNLAIAYRDKGDLQSAQAVAQRTVQLLQSNTENPDYKMAAEFLKDLNARIATGSAEQSNITAPAASPSSALEGENLPQVLDLNDPKPPVATPSAIPQR